MMVPLADIIPRSTSSSVSCSGSTPSGAHRAGGRCSTRSACLMRQYVRGIPLELEEAAAIDGAGRIRTFTTIILPLLKTPMTALGIFVFLGSGTTSSGR